MLYGRWMVLDSMKNQ